MIGGSLKGRTIRTLPGTMLRPTSDRVREALFDILGPRVLGSDFLDVYSGTGAIGIEALSRGAGTVVFVERDTEAVDRIRGNLAIAGDLARRAWLLPHDPVHAVSILEKEGRSFDLVFMDPPYSGGELDRGIRIIGRSRILKSGAIVVAEHDGAIDAPVSDSLAPYRTARYGRVTLTFYTSAAGFRRVDTPEEHS